MVLFFLAQGFEEVEALSAVDLLRRAGAKVVLAGVGGKRITGSHGITVLCDITAGKKLPEDPEMVVLPGGMPGTLHLKESKEVCSALRLADENGKWIAAICAAPSVLGEMGLLNGKEATCYPGFEDKLIGAKLSENYVCVDGKTVTARGVGVALEFGLKLVECLYGKEKADALKGTLQCRN